MPSMCTSQQQGNHPHTDDISTCEAAGTHVCACQQGCHVFQPQRTISYMLVLQLWFDVFTAEVPRIPGLGMRGIPGLSNYNYNYQMAPSKRGAGGGSATHKEPT